MTQSPMQNSSNNMEELIIALIPLIVNDAIPAAEKIWKMYVAKTITQDDWNQLTILTSKKASDIFSARLQAAGISPDSPQGKILLGLSA